MLVAIPADLQRFESINIFHDLRAKEKYRGVFEIQRSGDKTMSGKIGLDIRTHASPKAGQESLKLFLIITTSLFTLIYFGIILLHISIFYNALYG